MAKVLLRCKNDNIAKVLLFCHAQVMLKPLLLFFSKQGHLSKYQKTKLKEDFVNEKYRELLHFMDKHKPFTYKNSTLLGLAFDSGFNSKASFNRAFKRINGVTPSEYLKS